MLLNPKSVIKTIMCINLVLIGMVFGEFLDLFEVTQKQNIQTALEKSDFFPKEILIVLIVISVVLSIYLIYLTNKMLELKPKKAQQSIEDVMGDK